jgi:PKD repeat protein
MRKTLYLLPFLLLSVWAHAQVTILAPMPAQTSTFSTNARGYFFVAPSCFTLTGVEVPTTASTGPQSIAIVRFYATPPTYSATTNAFTTLFLTQNNPTTGMIPVNIQVEQGDIIGVMGVRSNINSYSNVGNTTTIEGFTVPLTRLGMQFPLATTAPTQLWTESAANITRCFMYYDTVHHYNLTYADMGGGLINFDNDADSSFTSVWDYGDGSALATAWNPSHTYAASGSYNVCTYITTSCGTDTLCTTVNVCIGAPTSGYTASNVGTTASFTNTTSGGATSYLWDFGDGSTDTTMNPSHTYASAGTYTVCLIASNTCMEADTLCNTVSVCDLPIAGFTYMDNVGGATDFMDASTLPTTYWWDFGDGGTDTVANPSHSYAANGTYTVCLITMNACGNDTVCDTVSVCPLQATSGFSSSSSAGVVDFTDASSNGLAVMWDFGDGGTDTSASPSHTYGVNGIYWVCQMVSNSCSADTLCDSVAACPDLPVASFTHLSSGLSATFTNTSSFGSSYSWDFGDGGTSASASPIHTYAANGLYNVCLTTWNLCGDSSFSCDSVLIDFVGVSAPQQGASVMLAPNPSSEETVLTVNFPGMSGEYSLMITDLRGTVVSLRTGLLNQSLTLDNRSLSAGVYLYHVSANGNSLGQGKMVVTH